MFKRFTPSARRVVLIATEEARGLGHADIGIEHLLLGALRSGGPSQFALAQLGLREGAIRARIGMRLPRGNAGAGTEISLAADAVWALAAAVRLADEGNDAQVGSAHVLRALVATVAARQILGDCEITADAVLAALRHQPADRDDAFSAAVAGLEGGDPAAAARALMAIVLRRGTVAAWLAERGVDEAALRRAFPGLERDAQARRAAADAG